MEITNENGEFIKEVGSHLTGMDNLFFDLESPRRLMTICSIWQFKASLDPTLILNALDNLCTCYPKFALVPKNGNFWETPIWSRPSSDWTFKKNLVFHSLKKSTKKDLQEYVASQYVKPFSYDKPLWQFHIISGFENNQYACFIKAHHALSDGIGIMRAVFLSTTSLDLPKQQFNDTNNHNRKKHLKPQIQQHIDYSNNNNHNSNSTSSTSTSSSSTSSSSTSSSSSSNHRSNGNHNLNSKSSLKKQKYKNEKQHHHHNGTDQDHSLNKKKIKRETNSIFQQIIQQCMPFLNWITWIWHSFLLIKDQMCHELWNIAIMMFPFFFKRRTFLYHGEQTYDKVIAWTEDLLITDIKYIQKVFGSQYTINDIMLTVFTQTIQRYLQYHHHHRSIGNHNNNNNNNNDDDAYINKNTYYNRHHRHHHHHYDHHHYDHEKLHIVIPLSYRLPTDYEMKNIVTGNLLQVNTSITNSQQLLNHIHRSMLCVKRSYFPYFVFKYYIQIILRYFPFLKLPSRIQNQYTEFPHAIFTNIIGPIEPIYFAGQELTHLHALAPQNGKGSISVGLVSYCQKINISMLTDDHPNYPDLANVLCKIFISEFNSLLTEAHMKNKL
ncbi:unnamed protein product [Cunninghamella blakesleeana]